MTDQDATTRRLGMEQEFFLVGRDGRVSDAADEVIAACEEVAAEAGVEGTRFEAEWVRNMVEIITPPRPDVAGLAAEYLGVLRMLLEGARRCGVRVYPLSSYPLHLIPQMRDSENAHVQLRTVGFERFLNAGRCTGTHLHVEVPDAIDERTGVALGASEDAKRELVDAYNLSTSLDPVLIALGRSCPFYEGHSTGLAYHTTRYRGSHRFGWDGVYSDLQIVGGLRPYADDAEHLVQMQFDRHHGWLQALDRAGVDRKRFHDSGGALLKSGWNPVRLNVHGTVELRNIDSNLPEVVIGIIALVDAAHRFVRERGLTVTPRAGQPVMAVEGDRLLVPDFEALNGPLLFAAVTRGLDEPSVKAYADSVRSLAAEAAAGPPWVRGLVPRPDAFTTTEARLLRGYYPSGERLSQSRGLELVRDCCDLLERQVEELSEAT